MLVPTEAEPVRVVCGDALDVMQGLPAESVQCCVTSPPYYGLRDYGMSGQIGLEPTPEEYVARLVAVFREVRRVLRPDGTLWLNMGDSYASSPPGNKTVGVSAKSGLNGVNSESGTYRERLAAGHATKRDTSKLPGVKPKDLLGIPWMVAFALRADGWYLRQDIIWAKPNPMPESVRDRCTKAHEYVFLLSKSPRYHYDAGAVKQRLSPVSASRYATGFGGKKANTDVNGKLRTRVRGDRKKPDAANLRSVWTITPKPYRGAHFAVMPPELVRRCVLAGCPAGGVVLDPFLGSGTVAAVALENGRRAVGCELNPDYIRLIHDRLAVVTPSLFAGLEG